MRCCTTEDNQIKQGVRAEAIRTVHGYTGCFAHGHEPGNDGIGVILGWAKYLCMDVCRNTAHVVVYRWQNRYRFLCYIHARKDLRGFGYTWQTFMQQIGAQMLQVEHDMIFGRATSAPGV